MRSARPPRAIDAAAFERSRKRVVALGSVPAAFGVLVWVKHAALGAVLGVTVAVTASAPRFFAKPAADRVAPPASVVGLREETVRPAAPPRSEPVVVPEPTRVRATLSAPAPSASPGLSREVALLEAARVELERRPGSALSLLAQHEREFSRGALALEREFLVVSALERLGRRHEAERERPRFAPARRGAYTNSGFASSLATRMGRGDFVRWIPKGAGMKNQGERWDMTKRRFTLALFALSFTGCAPQVTIADGSPDAGEGGEATNGGQGSGGTISTGGSHTSGAPTGGSHTSGTPTGGIEPLGRWRGWKRARGRRSWRLKHTPGGTSAGGSGGDAGDGGDAGKGECTGTVNEENSTSYESLEAYCAERGGSPATVEQAQEEVQERFCDIFTPLALGGQYGCGAIWVWYGPYADRVQAHGGAYYFDEASGELIGAHEFWDTPYGPCDVMNYVGGEPPACNGEPLRRCGICPNSTYPACRFDCDCSQPIGGDPCFAADSCECYCSQLGGVFN